MKSLIGRVEGSSSKSSDNRRRPFLAQFEPPETRHAKLVICDHTIDITYLSLHSGQWAYLATWLDLYSRKIVGWQVAAQMTAELVIGALRQAIVRECPPRGLIVHSDRGGQYVEAEFRQLLEANGYEQSMSRAGETYDNAFAESLFSRYKAELLEGGAFRDVVEAQMETFDYIEAYYNRVRRHSALGYVSPAEFERAYFQRTKDDLLTDQERS